uniref:Complex III subunit 9 n=1 Tax=Branchiostoma belcheri tsingtauense TaxID=155462 RepID=Q692Y5_BRABE|nr:mitochondrial ubiquinol-cytochrome c reductase [Branchiostoma belcheri tsingtauense]
MVNTVVRRVYNNLFKRTSTFALTILLGAVFFERAFDSGGDMLWDHLNRGKQWKDIKDKYGLPAEEEE